MRTATTLTDLPRSAGASSPASTLPAGMPTARLEVALTYLPMMSPVLLVDADVVLERYERLRSSLPGVEVFYAVKANPHPRIVRALVGRGASFDIASPGELEVCLEAGVAASQISYGNTIKKLRDVAGAAARDVGIYAFDDESELAKLSLAAPGSTVVCRIRCDGAGSDWPLGRKFGCSPEHAYQLLLKAAAAGHPVGVGFHPGSQQRRLDAWEAPLGAVAEIASALSERGIALDLVNLGGGLPSSYTDAVAPVEVYGEAILSSVARHLGPNPPRLCVEPGRYLVGDAGILRSQVVLVSRRGDERLRWVYLDVGVFSGMAETLGEAIRYRLRTRYDGGPQGPVAIAGPTCDSADVMYERSGYSLPLALRAGHAVDFLSAGAYTASYSSVGFNGFTPLRCVVLDPS